MHAGNVQEVNEGRRKSLQGTCCVHLSACKMQLAAGRCSSAVQECLQFFQQVGLMESRDQPQMSCSKARQAKTVFKDVPACLVCFGTTASECDCCIFTYCTSGENKLIRPDDTVQVWIPPEIMCRRRHLTKQIK